MSPSLRIASALGPMKVTPIRSHRSANAGSSPNPSMPITPEERGLDSKPPDDVSLEPSTPIDTLRTTDLPPPPHPPPPTQQTPNTPNNRSPESPPPNHRDPSAHSRPHSIIGHPDHHPHLHTRRLGSGRARSNVQLSPCPHHRRPPTEPRPHQSRPRRDPPTPALRALVGRRTISTPADTRSPLPILTPPPSCQRTEALPPIRTLDPNALLPRTRHPHHDRAFPLHLARRTHPPGTRRSPDGRDTRTSPESANATTPRPAHRTTKPTRERARATPRRRDPHSRPPHPQSRPTQHRGSLPRTPPPLALRERRPPTTPPRPTPTADRAARTERAHPTPPNPSPTPDPRASPRRGARTPTPLPAHSTRDMLHSNTSPADPHVPPPSPTGLPPSRHPGQTTAPPRHPEPPPRTTEPTPPLAPTRTPHPNQGAGGARCHPESPSTPRTLPPDRPPPTLNISDPHTATTSRTVDDRTDATHTHDPTPPPTRAPRRTTPGEPHPVRAESPSTPNVSRDRDPPLNTHPHSEDPAPTAQTSQRRTDADRTPTPRTSGGRRTTAGTPTPVLPSQPSYPASPPPRPNPSTTHSTVGGPLRHDPTSQRPDDATARTGRPTPDPHRAPDTTDRAPDALDDPPDLTLPVPPRSGVPSARPNPRSPPTPTRPRPTTPADPRTDTPTTGSHPEPGPPSKYRQLGDPRATGARPAPISSGISPPHAAPSPHRRIPQRRTPDLPPPPGGSRERTGHLARPPSTHHSINLETRPPEPLPTRSRATASPRALRRPPERPRGQPARRPTLFTSPSAPAPEPANPLEECRHVPGQRRGPPPRPTRRGPGPRARDRVSPPKYHQPHPTSTGGTAAREPSLLIPALERAVAQRGPPPRRSLSPPQGGSS